MSRVIFTPADYEEISQDQDCELIEGEIVVSPSATPYHQEIVSAIDFAIRRAITGATPSGRLFVDLDVELPGNTILRPDIAFVSSGNRRIIGEVRLTGAPDLVVEVLSPATAKRDREIKRRIYQQHGVREFWLVSPEAHTVQVLDFQAGTEKVYGRKDEFHSNVLAADLAVADLFPDD